MTHALRTLGLLALVTSVALAGCSRREEPAAPPAPPPPAASAPPVNAPAPLKVDELTLGSSLAADKSIANVTMEFAPTDTIYLSVKTSGTSPGATLAANWTYQDGQTVSQNSQEIAPMGPAVTEFHIAKPDGWPSGLYRVQVFVDGVEAGARELVVK